MDRQESSADVGVENVPVSPRSLSFETPAGSRKVILDGHNSRIKLYGLEHISELEYADVALTRARESSVSKTIVYARDREDARWKSRGFVREGVIRGYFPDHGDAVIWSRFEHPDRAHEKERDEHDRTITIATSRTPVRPQTPHDLTCRVATPDDATSIAELMGHTFSEYPETITPSSIANAICKQTKYFRLLWSGESLVSCASAEIDHENRSAELTDCSTTPDFRGQGLMGYLLDQLESDMIREFEIDVFYTIARADEIGMNVAFAKLGYDYTGRLVNNCRMPNGWESMNIWCKRGVQT